MKLSFVKKKLTDVVVLVLLGLALLASVVVTQHGHCGHHLCAGPGRTRRVPVAVALLKGIAVAVALLADTVLFAIVFSRLPGAKLTWRQVRSGALLAAVGFELLKLVGTFLIGRVTQNPLYATFGVVVGLLVWMNFVARLTVFAAAWTATQPYSLEPADLGEAGAGRSTGLAAGHRAAHPGRAGRLRAGAGGPAGDPVCRRPAQAGRLAPDCSRRDGRGGVAAWRCGRAAAAIDGLAPQCLTAGPLSERAGARAADRGPAPSQQQHPRPQQAQRAGEGQGDPRVPRQRRGASDDRGGVLARRDDALRQGLGLRGGCAGGFSEPTALTASACAKPQSSSFADSSQPGPLVCMTTAISRRSPRLRGTDERPLRLGRPTGLDADRAAVVEDQLVLRVDLEDPALLALLGHLAGELRLDRRGVGRKSGPLQRGARDQGVRSYDVVSWCGRRARSG